MELRRFGRSGYRATILTLGGCGLGHLSQEEADKAIEFAMQHKVNMIDVAPTYGDAELRLRPWIEKHRNDFFLACKTVERTKPKASEELSRSLVRLGTDHVDLYQFHGVSTENDLKQIFGKDGALEAFKEARETGLTKYVGITGHEDIRVLIKGLEQFDFDTVLAPVTVASMINPEPQNDFRPLLRMTLDRDVGVIAIKAISRRRWIGQKNYTTWYEPLEKQSEIDMALWFALSQEGVTSFSLSCDVKLWPALFDAATRFQRRDAQKQHEIVRFAQEHEFKPLFPV